MLAIFSVRLEEHLSGQHYGVCLVGKLTLIGVLVLKNILETQSHPVDGSVGHSESDILQMVGSVGAAGTGTLKVILFIPQIEI